MDPFSFFNTKIGEAVQSPGFREFMMGAGKQVLLANPLTGPATLLGSMAGVGPFADQPDTPEATRKIGQRAVRGGKDVLWAGPTRGYQSPESYKSLFGALPADYKPSSTSGAAGSLSMPSGGSITEAAPSPPLPGASDISGSAATAAQPPGGVQQLGEGTTIPQTQEPIGKEAVELLKKFADPEYLSRLGKDRLDRLLVSEFFTSGLRGEREQAKYLKEEQIKKIEAWRDLQVAATEANARKEVALASTIATAMAPNTALAQAMTQQYQAAMAPFTLRRG